MRAIGYARAFRAFAFLDVHLKRTSSFVGEVDCRLNIVNAVGENGRAEVFAIRYKDTKSNAGWMVGVEIYPG